MASSSSSISGLVSGLDTSTIISQLMQLEAASQTRLKSRVNAEQAQVTALQSINTKTAAIATKAAALAKASTWSAVTATSSNTSLTATAGTTARPTSLSVTVTAVARTHQLGFKTAAALTDHVTGGSTTVLVDRLDGTDPVAVDTGDGTLKGLVDAINDPDNATGLRATAIKTADGYRLLVESTATGAAQDFDLIAEDGTALLGGATVRQGSNAELDLGAGITATSTTNTFTDLLPGLSVTVSPSTTLGATSTITVQQSATDLSTAVSDLVTAINAALSEVDKDTAYDATTKASGTLSGDAVSRSARSALLNTVFTRDNTSLAAVGISTTRDGKLVFDATAFQKAYTADPDGVAAKFTTATNGFAARVQKAAEGLSDAHTGSITAAIAGRQSGIKRLQTSIDDWDVRLEKRQETLTRQFTALETALSNLQSQSSWLSSQLSSLSSSSSS